jgi:hypothetical protein
MASRLIADQAYDADSLRNFRDLSGHPDLIVIVLKWPIEQDVDISFGHGLAFHICQAF